MSSVATAPPNLPLSLPITAAAAVAPVGLEGARACLPPHQKHLGRRFERI